MNYKAMFEKWMDCEIVDAETKNELLNLIGREDELKTRFSKMLHFGTAGLRGIIGAGLNRMNIYTVRFATQGLSDLILEEGVEGTKRGVCIAYDSRQYSEVFAWEAACTLSANGISVFIFDECRPTPELSFSIRELGAIAGINITASHNPKEYNGYKVYWEDGAQLPPQHAVKISNRLGEMDIFTDVKTCSKEEAMENGYITVMGKDCDEIYIEKVLAESVGKKYVTEAAGQFRLIYTPIHGTGYRLVPEVLRRLGVKGVRTVPEQIEPDGSFPTTRSPNPEEKEALELAIDLANREGIDLVIGTDPDCDRVGIAVRNHQGMFQTLTGNQIGVLLLEYLIKMGLENGTLHPNSVVIKSIVSTDMARKITNHYGIHLIDVLTGFKYIGEKIKEFEEKNEHRFLFGFEESNGYLVGTYARDKDAVVASMLIAEMACYYSMKNLSLFDALQKLYKKYGYFNEHCESITINGLNGVELINSIMKNLRSNPLLDMNNTPVMEVRDYKTGVMRNVVTGKEEFTNLPQADVLFYELKDGSSIVIRPSGTEPKLKLYIMVKADSKENVEEKIEQYLRYCKTLIEKMSQNDIYI